MQEPKRRVTVSLDISADSMSDVAVTLEHLRDAAYRGMLAACSYTSSSKAYVLRVQTNPEQTHDKYVAEVEAYLEHVKERNEAAVAGRRDGGDTL